MTDEIDHPHITGYFVRVQREGRWVNRDIADLTSDELEAFFDKCDADRRKAWAIALASWIRDCTKDGSLSKDTTNER